jgi:hypothetical protein
MYASAAVSAWPAPSYSLLISHHFARASLESVDGSNEDAPRGKWAGQLLVVGTVPVPMWMVRGTRAVLAVKAEVVKTAKTQDTETNV